MNVAVSAEGGRGGRARALAALGWIVSLATLAGVVIWAAHQPAPRFESGPGALAGLAGALAVYALATVLRAERWHRLLGYEGGRPSRADSAGLTTVGFMGNNVLPARAGDAMRVYLMAPRSGLRMRDVVGTLIAERLLDVLVLLGLFIVLAFGILRGVAIPAATGLAILAGAGLLLLAILGTALYVFRETERGRAVIELARSLIASTAGLRGPRGVAMLGLTVLTWICEAACYLLVGVAVGVELAPLDALYLIAVAGVFVLIPSGPGYAGTLDAGILFGLGAAAITGSAALSFLIMLRFVLLVPITAVGATLVVSRYGGFRRGRAAAHEVSA